MEKKTFKAGDKVTFLMREGSKQQGWTGVVIGFDAENDKVAVRWTGNKTGKVTWEYQPTSKVELA